MLRHVLSELAIEDPYYALLTLILIVSIGAVGYAINHLATRRPKPRRDAVVIIGEPLSGKTTLFVSLQQGSAPRQTDKQLDREAKFVPIGLEFSDKQSLTANNLRFVDLSTRARLHKTLRTARGVVFVVDATKDMEPAADYLFDVLTAPDVASGAVPILIACSHSDDPQAKSAQRVQQELLQQLNSMRSPRNELEPILAKHNPALAKRKAHLDPFDHHPAAISFAEVSCPSSDVDVRSVLSFIERIL